MKIEIRTCNFSRCIYSPIVHSVFLFDYVQSEVIHRQIHMNFYAS